MELPEWRPAPPAGPCVLLVATMRWPLAARLAIAFRALGCRVQGCCPAGHPLEMTGAVDRIFRFGELAPRQSLVDALRGAAPDLVVPCDDDAAIHLHELHRAEGVLAAPAALRGLIERSLGTPASCTRATARGDLMELALAEGVRVPATGRLSSPEDLERWGMQHGFPAMLKADRSCGGRGVTLVHDAAEASRTLRAAARPSLLRALSHLLLRRDGSPVLRYLRRQPAAITAQKFIVGRPANCAVACWQGEVLAGNSVVALETQGATGPATVVELIDNAEMAEAARRLVRALGLSGFCGLDFVIESASGAAFLIELNPRATPIGHLALGAGHDLPAALVARLAGAPAPAPVAVAPNTVIAMFPGEWRRDPLSPYLRSALHDVPWGEIALVRDCTDLPWEDRGVAARIRAHFNPRRAPAHAWFPSPERAGVLPES